MLANAAMLLAVAVAAACGGALAKEGVDMARGRPERPSMQPSEGGRLRARPGPPAGDAPRGLQTLGPDGARDGLLYVPASYEPAHPAPFALMLHGAGGNAQHGIYPFLDLADGAGMILLAPDSRGPTWDLLRGGYGPDVALADRVLHEVFSRYAVDPAHLAVEGFSDGASYALSLGLTNGDLFTHVLAFSPGFAAPAARAGQPRLFVSHGTRDAVLPIDQCSRRIVPALERAGYTVRYEEFDGGHTMPPELVQAALTWLLNSPA